MAFRELEEESRLLRAYTEVSFILDPGSGDNLKKELLPPIDQCGFVFLFFDDFGFSKETILPYNFGLDSKCSEPVLS